VTSGLPRNGASRDGFAYQFLVGSVAAFAGASAPGAAFGGAVSGGVLGGSSGFQ
jgi:hypothetical protein